MAETAAADAPNVSEKGLATQQIERFQALGDKILERSDLAAKAVTTFGSGAIGAVGIVKARRHLPLTRRASAPGLSRSASTTCGTPSERSRSRRSRCLT